MPTSFPSQRVRPMRPGPGRRTASACRGPAGESPSNKVTPAGTNHMGRPPAKVPGQGRAAARKTNGRGEEFAPGAEPRAIDFLKRHQGRPCVVSLWPDDPHTPWVPGPDAPRGDTPGTLRAVLLELDRQVGRLLDGLRGLGIERDTLVLFTSDNGPLPAFRGARTAGLRGSKLSLYEGGVRVPLLVRWPGRVPAGRVDEQTVAGAVDLLPTLCAVAGAGLPRDTALDGEDLSAALFGEPVVRKRPLFWEYGRNQQFFSYPRAPRDRSPNVAVRDGRWKLLVNDDGSGAELYDLAADPDEARDLAAARPDLARRLAKQALDWRRSLP